MGKLARTDRVVWIDRGWQPVEIGFCPSETAWKREMKAKGWPGTPYPENDASATHFTHDGQFLVLVALAEDVEKRFSRVVIAGLLAHEATHVWQHVRRQMQEAEPSIEFEAYAIQAIFQSLYQAWLGTRAPDAMKAACASVETAEA